MTLIINRRKAVDEYKVQVPRGAHTYSSFTVPLFCSALIGSSDMTYLEVSEIAHIIYIKGRSRLQALTLLERA